MAHLGLSDYAKALRVGSDNALADFGTEILDLIDDSERLEFLEGDVIEPIENAASHIKGQPDRAAEWLVDREKLLSEIESKLADAGLPGDADDVLAKLLNDLEDLRTENAALKAPDVLEYDL